MKGCNCPGCKVHDTYELNGGKHTCGCCWCGWWQCQQTSSVCYLWVQWSIDKDENIIRESQYAESNWDTPLYRWLRSHSAMLALSYRSIDTLLRCPAHNNIWHRDKICFVYALLYFQFMQYGPVFHNVRYVLTGCFALSPIETAAHVPATILFSKLP